MIDFGRKIKPELATFAGTMSNAGYECWYVGKWHNDGRPVERGYHETNGLFAGGGGRWAVPQFDWLGRPVTGYRGWIFQTDDGARLLEKGVGLSPNISEQFGEAAVAFIQRPREKPFFLHVNFTAPHDPLFIPFGYEDRYDPAKIPVPKNFMPEHPFDHGNLRGRDEQLFDWPRTKQEVRGELAAYYAQISLIDAQVGRIRAALEDAGQLENTVFIYTSDHGLAVGSHGLRGKQSMYEHTINVPLVMSGPGIPPGKRTPAQCHLRDLFPTVCELSGVKIPDSVEGRSLKPVLDGKTDSIYTEVFGYFRNFQRMIRTNDGWKLNYYPAIDRTQLFHVAVDPDELRDLADDPQHRRRREALRSRLETWRKQVDDPSLKP